MSSDPKTQPTKTIDDFVSVPHTNGHRMVLLKRHARLLAGGGTIDLERGIIVGGDPHHDAYPEGTQPLSGKEAQRVRERYALS